MNTILAKLKDPGKAALVAGLVGLALGLLWAWVIQPVEFVDATPVYLRADLQEDYLRMTIDSFAVNGDLGLALQRWDNLGAAAVQHLQTIEMNPGAQDPAMILAFKQLVEANRSLEAPAAADEGGGKSKTWLLLGLVVGIIAVIGVGYFGIRLLRPSISKSSKRTAAQIAAERSKNVEVVDYEAAGQTPPMSQFVTTYVFGDNLFDDSFSVEAANGEFLGECGVGISETIGVGMEDKHVAAFEVWLFDKNDIQTVTKVVMSEHLFNDEAARQRLAEKGEPVLAAPKKQITLETATLRIVATIVEMGYGQGALPPNSYFEHMTVELAVWKTGDPPAAQVLS